MDGNDLRKHRDPHIFRNSPLRCKFRSRKKDPFEGPLGVGPQCLLDP